MYPHFPQIVVKLMLTLKIPSKIAADDIIIFRENKI